MFGSRRKTFISFEDFTSYTSSKPEESTKVFDETRRISEANTGTSTVSTEVVYVGIRCNTCF